MKKPFSFSSLCTAFCFAAMTLLAADNPFVGTWKLNTDKSKFAFSPGPTNFMFATVRIEAAANGLKFNSENTTGSGETFDFKYEAQLDGTPVRITGSRLVDSATCKRIDDHTIAATESKEGKLVYTDRRVVSADNSSMTIVRNGTLPDGKPYENTMFFDRVK